MADPALSVIVVIVSDTTDQRADAAHLLGCLGALSRQIDAPSFEIIVPYHVRTDGMESVSRMFPDVRLIRLDEPETLPARGGGREHHDVLRARGLAAARGEIVGLLEDHGRPAPAWCATAARAHRQPGAAVGGAIENGIDRPLNWAVYYCDFGRYQNPLPAGATGFASDANVAYKRSALESIRHVWEASFHETQVNAALEESGERLLLEPGMIVYQHREGLRLVDAIRERFIWGRSYAATRTLLVPGHRRAAYAALSPGLPAILTTRMLRRVVARRRTIRSFLQALPAIALLTVSWSLGELLGYVTGAGGATARRPVSTHDPSG